MRRLHAHLINQIGSVGVDKLARKLLAKALQGDGNLAAMELLMKYMLGVPAKAHEIESGERAGITGGFVFVFPENKPASQISAPAPAPAQILPGHPDITDAELVAEPIPPTPPATATPGQVS